MFLKITRGPASYLWEKVYPDNRMACFVSIGAISEYFFAGGVYVFGKKNIRQPDRLLNRRQREITTGGWFAERSQGAALYLWGISSHWTE